MAFGTAKTKAPTGSRPPQEILVALDEALRRYRADPELLAATERHAELQRIASEASAHEAGCRETLRALSWQIYEPGVIDDEKRIESALAEAQAQLATIRRQVDAEIKSQRRPAQHDLQLRGRLNDRVIVLKAELDTIQGRVRASTPRLSSIQVQAAPPSVRTAFRAALVALEAAIAANKAAAEPARDAVAEREQAKQAAIDRVTPLLLPLHAQAIRTFDATLEAARDANGVMQQIFIRLSGVFGSRLPIEHVGWPEFEPGRKLDAWRETLPSRAPHARLK